MMGNRVLVLLVASLAVVSGRQLKEDKCSAVWGQCGGLTWTGPKCCESGSVCTPQGGNKYYSQCLPGSSTPSPSPSPSPSTPDGGAPGAAAYYNTVTPRLSEEEAASVLAAFDAWNAALLTHDPEAVADMYTEDAVLVPTLSNVVRTTRAGLVDYFTGFLAKGPTGELDEYNIRLEEVDDAGAPYEVSNGGVYTFRFKDGSSVQARYTFVYRLVAGEWKIRVHHSSQMPSKFVQSTTVADPEYANTADPALTKAEVAGVLAAFDIWNDALATGDPHKVVDLYTPDAVLLPTLSDDVRATQAERVDYFKEFLANKPQGKLDEWNIRLEGVDELGEPLEVSNSGIYTFTFAVTGKVVQGRYTFVYQRDGDRWMIRQHHSSQMPQHI